MKNAYVLKLQERRAQEDLALVQKTLHYVARVVTLAMNMDGLGKTRIKRIKGYFDELNSEYLEALNDGSDYAEQKLNEAYEKVMGEPV